MIYMSACPLLTIQCYVIFSVSRFLGSYACRPMRQPNITVYGSLIRKAWDFLFGRTRAPLMARWKAVLKGFHMSYLWASELIK